MSTFVASGVQDTGVELYERLEEVGVTIVAAWVEDGSTHVTVADADDAVAGPIVTAYQPAPDYRRPLPEAIRVHRGHLRDYRDAVRAGQTPTAAQTVHVVADLIDALRLQVAGDDRL